MENAARHVLVIDGSRWVQSCKVTPVRVKFYLFVFSSFIIFLFFLRKIGNLFAVTRGQEGRPAAVCELPTNMILSVQSNKTQDIPPLCTLYILAEAP